MITIARDFENQYSDPQSMNEDYWTMLILSSSNFFPPPTQEHPDIDWEMVINESGSRIAEVTIIVYAIGNAEERWGKLNEYIESLLVEDFMDPKAYTMLLFDDETFSRSRLYFWIIGCLNEFDLSIEDNIKQWKLFRQARISHHLESSSHSHNTELDKLRKLDGLGEQIRQRLENLQTQFRAKIATVQALRDGVSVPFKISHFILGTLKLKVSLAL